MKRETAGSVRDRLQYTAEHDHCKSAAQDCAGEPVFALRPAGEPREAPAQE